MLFINDWTNNRINHNTEVNEDDEGQIEIILTKVFKYFIIPVIIVISIALIGLCCFHLFLQIM